MRKLISLVLLFATVACAHAQEPMTLVDSTTLIFATVEEGRAILKARDDFVQRLSPFDRASRMKTDQVISEEVYLEFVGKSVLPWDDSAKQRVEAAFYDVQAELSALALPLPKRVLLVKTTGDEEGGAAYTRANAIVFPQVELDAPAEKLQMTICHELFHVLSRANPSLRDELYSTIGFVKCDEVPFPPALRSRKLTNPDAPGNDHCIRVQVDGQNRWAVPILFSSAETYDVDRGGEFFEYLQFQFLLGGDKGGKPSFDAEQPQLGGIEELAGFFEQVGQNTAYIIHPEEILADNFALLIRRESDWPSPEIVEKLKDALAGARE